MGEEPAINNYFVSIIIPTYNRVEPLRFCMERLLEQTYKNFEVIICDDGSTDYTEEVANEYHGKLNMVYITDSNFGGPARPRNRGIKRAKGNIIAFLDSDDWWYPNKLEESLKYIDEYDVVYHDLDMYTSYTKSKGVVRGRVLVENIAKDLVINGGIPNSSIVIKKSIIDKVGIISEDRFLIAVEDSDYWIRTALITQKFKYIEKSLGGYWIGNNISVSEKQIEREEALFNKHKYLLDVNELRLAEINLALRKARIFHKTKNFKSAYHEYMISVKNKNIKIKIKSYIGLVTSYLKIKL